MKNRIRLLLLATVLTGTALLSTARPAAACDPYMCWIVDENTACCWTGDCQLWCG
jgi:hypothetical protein